MKEWCLKHPILTYLIIDEILTYSYNIVCKVRSNTTKEAIGEAIDETVNKISKEVNKHDSKKKQPIGFKAV